MRRAFQTWAECGGMSFEADVFRSPTPCPWRSETKAEASAMLRLLSNPFPLILKSPLLPLIQKLDFGAGVFISGGGFGASGYESDGEY